MNKTITLENINELVKKYEEAELIQGKSGYNMYDVVPMDVTPVQKAFQTPSGKNIFSYLKVKINLLNQESKDLIKHGITLASIDGFDKFVEDIVKRYNVAREQVISEYGDLPVEGLKKINLNNNNTEIDDVLTKAALAPRASLSVLKEVAEKMGFMITTWDHHNKRSFENENKPIKNAIAEFEDLDEYMDLYVISPLIYWDIEAIVKDDNPNKWSFTSSKIQNIVHAISIQLPTLRNFHARISDLESNVDQLNTDSAIYKKSIQEIYSELDRIDKELEKIKVKQAEQDVEIATARREAAAAFRAAAAARDEAAAARDMAMRAIDPLLFAVPKGHDMEKECSVIVGPVWGPDFHWLALATERLDANLEQRKMIEKINPFLI